MASYANLTADQCFGLPLAEQQVACSAQHLNVTNPPSIYDWNSYSSLWQPITCLLSNVTYANRVDLPDEFNYCSVPLEGNDVFLFASLAMLASACLFGSLAVVWVLIAGGVLGVASYYLNLRELSNGVALWLGISPPDLFFYAFIPPLAVDSALKLDFFLFRKTWPHMLLTAFVMVILSAFLLTPIVLFGMGFSERGFNWGHVALFSAMIASTDALSSVAILKRTGGPERLVTLIEGESLLNDASAITLFNVFKNILEDNSDPSKPFPSVWSSIPTILTDTLRYFCNICYPRVHFIGLPGLILCSLAGIGLGVGLAISMALGYLLRWLRWRGARPHVESIAVLACSFLSFYVANSPAKGSGVIAVVVFGLYGNFTRKWGMLSSSEESGAFEAFWDATSLGANGLVFWWSGCACINFLVRSVGLLSGSAWSWAAIPVIFVAMTLLRTGCIAAFNVTVFRWLRETLSWAEVVFSGWAGLRGSVSLIMIADFLNYSTLSPSVATGEEGTPAYTQRFVNAEITLWTASFVLLTLVINAPTLGPLVRLLKLDGVGGERWAGRARAKRALMRFTAEAIDSLRSGGTDELLQGANWEAVSQYCDLSAALPGFDPPASREAACHGTEQSPAQVAGQLPTTATDEDSNHGRQHTISSMTGQARKELPAHDSSRFSSSKFSDDSDVSAICAEVSHEVPYLAPEQAQRATSSPAAVPLAADTATAAAPLQKDQVESSSSSLAAARGVQGSEDGDSAASYYASLPSAAGRQLLQQLQSSLQASGSRAASGEGAPSSGTLLPLYSSAADKGKQPAAHAGDRDSDQAYYSSMPAAMGSKVKQQLQQQLQLSAWQGWSKAQQGSMPGSIAVSGGPSSPGRAPLASARQHAASRGMGMEAGAQSHPHVTISGAAGATLAAELQRQLAAQRNRGSAAMPLQQTGFTVPQRDLLGRKLARVASAADRSTTAAATAPSAAAAQPLGPPAAPFSAQLAQLRRVRTFAETPSQPGSGVPSATPSGAASPRSQLLELAFKPMRDDRSWQHRPLRAATGAGGVASAGLAELDSSQLHLPRPMSVGQVTPVQVQSGVHITADGRSGGGGPTNRKSSMASEHQGNDSFREEKEKLQGLRHRLVAGLKRHCHARRLQGMLSAEGLRTLDYAYDRGAEQASQPLHLWRLLEKEVEGGPIAWLAARMLYYTVRGYLALPRLLQWTTSWPFRKLSGWLRRVLGNRMLAACEVAIEYWLALAQSPLAQWAERSPENAWRLQEEVQAELAAVQHFIASKEIEAPERFQAIQSYRAAMVVLRQQAAFVQELYASGAVDEAEREEMLEPLDRRRYQLEITGPVWKPPRPRTLLRGLPFMRHLAQAQFREILVAGSIREYSKGEVFWKAVASPDDGQQEPSQWPDSSSSPGLYIVLAGVVRHRHQRPDGTASERFLGAGSVVGVLLATTGTSLRGSESAVAEGNSLGRGPLLFHMPQSVVGRLLLDAGLGKPASQQLRLELLRLAASYVVDCTAQGMAFAAQSQGQAAVKDSSKLRPTVAPTAGVVSPVRTASSVAQLETLMQQIAAEEVEEELLHEPRAMPAEVLDGRLASNNPSGATASTAWSSRMQVVASVRRGLHSATLLELAAGAGFAQTAHAVVLKGEIHHPHLGVSQQMRAVRAPAVMAWLGQPGLHWRAGSSGALLLVCAAS